MRYVFYAPNGAEEEQRKGIKDYFSYRGIYSSDCTSLFTDNEYRDSKYDIGIKEMLSNLSDGDVLYVWDLSCLAKSIRSLYVNLLFGCNLGITIIQCIDGEVLGNNTSDSNAVLRGIGIASRIDFNAKQSISRQTAAKRRDLIEKEGGYYTKSGKWKTSLGRGKGADMTRQHSAAWNAIRDRSQEWRLKSEGYQWVIEQLKAGVSRKEIIEEFNRRHLINPEAYSTRQGHPLSKGLLSRWASEISIIKV